MILGARGAGAGGGGAVLAGATTGPGEAATGIGGEGGLGLVAGAVAGVQGVGLCLLSE